MAVLECCNVQPSPEPATELVIPLVHFDIVFLLFHPIQRLLFFEFPCSKSQFLETIVPRLKDSFAQSLSDFLPLAGKIFCPVDSGRPVSRFTPGDSVPLTIAESEKDFDVLTGNQPRLADDFYDCVPEIPPAKRSENEVVFPALALQITLFPGRGVCLGIANDHGIGDASSIVRFIKHWASVNSFAGDRFPPVLDRTTVVDPEGLDSINWNVVKKSRPMESSAIHFPINKFRSTYTLSNDDVQRLKRFVLKNRPGVHVTTFTVTCGLVWACLAKAESAVAAVADDESEYFAFPADSRGRLNPPLPASYFGNCLALVKAEISHGSLKGDGGFVEAAARLGDAIKKTVYNPAGILDGAETWLEEFGELVRKRLFGVAGSPRFDLYDVDFGWGRPRKFEAASIDLDTSMSLCKSRGGDGGVEIGLSRRKDVLDAFAAAFAETLDKL
ncbi:phenolic glucoside malonyltransferase 1-like [Andrographis paniculata]|uniref:phenolic glucoside malonyltransferase 1-like n=1 Tax=Andrographis paniculata TaxID=175694 RepID=UPI0021E8FCDD|nr:phenolic glucoside malonyltransferase 1-like [Andrographis paniculata]